MGNVLRKTRPAFGSLHIASIPKGIKPNFKIFLIQMRVFITSIYSSCKTLTMLLRRYMGIRGRTQKFPNGSRQDFWGSIYFLSNCYARFRSYFVIIWIFLKIIFYKNSFFQKNENICSFAVNGHSIVCRPCKWESQFMIIISNSFYYNFLTKDTKTFYDLFGILV